MTQSFPGAFSEIFRRFSRRLFFGQWVGNLLLMLLAAGWLQMPDSHAWQFAFSILSGLLLVAGFLWLYDLTFRTLRACDTPLPRWLSFPLLALFVLLWLLLLHPIAIGRAHESLVAGYLNSQSSTWLRYHLGYSSLVACQERIYDCLQLVWAGLLLPVVVELCGCGFFPGWLRRPLLVYRRWFYWLAVLVCGLGASALTWSLAEWTPAAGLAGQTVSVVLRLGLAYTVDILLWCFLLALIAYYLDAPSPGRIDLDSSPLR